MKYLPFYAKTLNTVKRSNNVMKATTLLIAISFLYSCSNEKLQVAAPAAQSLPVIAINTSTETTFLDYPASIQGAVDVEIRPQVSGYLEHLYVNEGAAVKAGQPLFKINELPYREQLNNAKANLRAAEASVLNAQLEIDKLLPLVQNKVVSEIQLQSAKTAHQIALATVAQAKATVATAQINLGYTLIKAPVSGYIGRLPKKQGSLVSAADPMPLTQLSDVHDVHVYFSLAEADFVAFNAKYDNAASTGNLKKLPPVSLLLTDNQTYAHKGHIDMVDGQFDKNTGAITLRATFSNDKGVLRSGNTGTVRLSLQHEGTIVIPQSATVEMQDKVFVYTLDKDNKVSRQPVKVVGMSGTNYLISNGLKTGDRIVAKGMDLLKDGDAVKPEISKESTLKVAVN